LSLVAVEDLGGNCYALGNENYDVVCDVVCDVNRVEWESREVSDDTTSPYHRTLTHSD
jgi:hypothetical protein